MSYFNYSIPIHCFHMSKLTQVPPNTDAPSSRPYRSNSVTLLRGLPALVLLTLPHLVMAAETQPNAGSLLGTVPNKRLEPAKPSGSPVPGIPADAATVLPASKPFLVREMRIEGNTVFDSATLEALLAPMVGQSLTLPQIGEGIEAITAYYRAAGYPLARTIIPVQVIENGVFRVRVIEANWGRVDLTNNSSVQDAVVLRTISDLQMGSVVRLDTLERATLLLSDLPGVMPRALLRAGQETGSSDLVVEVDPGAPLIGSILVDNFGSRFTGVERSGGNVQWNNPLRRGDTLAANVLDSAGGGMKYARLAYEIPVWSPGVQAGLDKSGLQYKLGDSSANLLASGKVDTSSLWLRTALLRSPGTNLNARLSFNSNILQDHVDATGVKTDRTVNLWSIELNGDRQDAWFGQGQNTLGLAGYGGRVGFDDPTAETLDAGTAKSEGGFSRATWSFTRNQSLAGRWSALVSLNGQWAQKNLDSSQKFSIGGANSVRAYRSGVLSGDTGTFGSLTVRYLLPNLPGMEYVGNWQLSGFVDTASVQTNKNPWSSGSNEASLSGAGVGLNWQGPKGWSGRAFIAASLGELPSQLAGSESTHTNAWVELAIAF